MTTAIIATLLFIAGCVLAGIAAAPMFNMFAKPERQRPKSGCLWIFGTIGCWWLAVVCAFSVPNLDQNGQPVDPAAMNSWDEPTTVNAGEVTLAPDVTAVNEGEGQ